MSEKIEKATLVKLDEKQLKELFVLIDHYITKEITDKLKLIDDKLEKLATGLTKIEAELRLLRIDIKDRKT